MTDFWNPAESINAVRSELRTAIFYCLFWQSAVEVQPDLAAKHEQSMKKQQACVFVQFGVRSGLFSPSEGNDWLDAIWGIQKLATVVEKYEAAEAV